MKCPHCGLDIFEGQFRCGYCNKIVELEYPDEKKTEPKKKDKKEKE